jgi:hypothetical protein
VRLDDYLAQNNGSDQLTRKKADQVIGYYAIFHS